MKISIRLSLVSIYSLFFRKVITRFFPGDFVVLRHDVRLSDNGRRFPKGTLLRVMLQYTPGIYSVLVAGDRMQDCFTVSLWSLRKESVLDEMLRETERRVAAQ